MPGIFYPNARVTLNVVFEDFGENNDPLTFHVLPIQASVFANSYQEADTWSVEFDAKDFPFSPELVRAGAVEIYIFGTRGLRDRSTGITKGVDNLLTNATVAGDPNRFTVDGTLLPSVTGLIDSAETEYTDDGRVVRLDGRDYTALFLDKEWPKTRVPTKSGRGKGKLTGRRIPAGKSLLKQLNEFVEAVDIGNNMRVKVEPDGLAEEVNKIIIGKSEGRAHKRGIPVPNKSNYWDVMTLLATRYGFIIFVRGLEVVLTTPQALQAGKTTVTKMAWGQNLSRLGMKRKIGKERVPVVEVRSYNEKTRTVVRGQFPKKGETAATGLGTDREQIRRFVIPNIVDQKQLDRVAENAYNLLSRAELTVSIETEDLTDLEGNDVLALRTGDSLGIKFDPFNNELLESMTAEQRFQFLREAGYQPAVAEVVSERYGELDSFREPFRVREAVIDYSVDDGINITAELIQFVNVARSDAENAAQKFSRVVGKVFA